MSQPEPDNDDVELRVHGTCVALGEKSVLFTGASGAGKSACALGLIAYGARLISDDQVILRSQDESVTAHSIEGYEGLIEARGIGILQIEHQDQAALSYVVDMDTTELQRLPPERFETYFGINIPKIHGRENPALIPSLLTLMRTKRIK